MNEPPKSKWHWRLLRWGLIGLAMLVTLIAVVVTEEDWRGKHDWDAYRAQAAARGEPIDVLLNTNNIPDDQNFTKAPIFSSLANLQWNSITLEWEPGKNNSEANRLKMSIYRSDGSYPVGGAGDFNRTRLTNLKVWQTYYRNPGTSSVAEFPIAVQPQSPAADVLLALSKYDQPIEELRSASLRPCSLIGNGDFTDPNSMGLLMLYVGVLKNCCQVVELRALAELADGEGANALEDVKLLSRLNDKICQEPLLISHLVSLALMHLVLQPVYEGLAQNQWSDAQLAELERVLAAKNFLADYQMAIRGERAFAISSEENLRLTREFKTFYGGSGTNDTTTVSLNWTPSAFFYQTELNIARLDDQLLPLVDPEKRTSSPVAQHRVSAVITDATKHFNPYKILAVMTVEAYAKTVVIFTFAQSQTDLARTACALERYRLAHGSYPDTLDVLAPQFIDAVPHDVINGQPLHYHLTANGQFILYSVGWNETDDGGQIALNKHGVIDREKGDWVWQYPSQ